MTTETKEFTTSYSKSGNLGIPANFTGHVYVWGFDCVPDHYLAVDGRIVKTVFTAPGDWTQVR